MPTVSAAAILAAIFPAATYGHWLSVRLLPWPFIPDNRLATSAANIAFGGLCTERPINCRGASFTFPAAFV
ncbi:hypothetical protein [Endozoicomonas atrinae]|uniref:hypothetical protein n=1 Tax=Endozoicomonas atrinae TaxID=1333660 RepID=UPI000A935501|nr:hypothetical protein [Endozoicomonas atrinae]